MFGNKKRNRFAEGIHSNKSIRKLSINMVLVYLGVSILTINSADLSNIFIVNFWSVFTGWVESQTFKACFYSGKTESLCRSSGFGLY